MDKIFITDLLARGVIGIHEWERQRPQDILINIVVDIDLQQASRTDDVRASIDYDLLSRKVIMHAESVSRLTVEALANDIAEICLAEPGAECVLVKVEKPGAVQFAKSVGVEIQRKREN